VRLGIALLVELADRAAQVQEMPLGEAVNAADTTATADKAHALAVLDEAGMIAAASDASQRALVEADEIATKLAEVEGLPAGEEKMRAERSLQEATAHAQKADAIAAQLEEAAEVQRHAVGEMEHVAIQSAVVEDMHDSPEKANPSFQPLLRP